MEINYLKVYITHLGSFVENPAILWLEGVLSWLKKLATSCIAYSFLDILKI